MSVKVQALIWEIAPYRGNTLLAFLALGDWSDDDGVCWPKMPSLARKSRQSLRSAQYAIEQMCVDGFVAVHVNPGRGNENEFQINMQKLHDLFKAGKNMQFAPKHAKRDIAIRKNRHEPSVEPKSKSFALPSLEEIRFYVRERGNLIDPEAFFNFYESKGWRVGSQPMKNWQAAIRTWETRLPKRPVGGIADEQVRTSARQQRSERNKQNILDGLAAKIGHRDAFDGLECEVGTGTGTRK